MAKNAFSKKYMHPTRRKLVDMVLSGGEYDKNAQISFSTSDKEEIKREVGEKWTDDFGNEWEQLSGGTKIKTSRLTDTMKDIRKWLNEQKDCKNKSCDKIKYGPTDKKLIKKTGFCSNCLADKEAQIRYDGLFDEYATYRITQNQLSYAKDVLENLNDALVNVKNKIEYVNEDGTMDTWTIDRDINELRGEIQEDIDKVKEEIKTVLEARDKAWEKLKDKNYDLIGQPVEIQL
jgi:phage-related minor tail protein